jgi:hypothetical protein
MKTQFKTIHCLDRLRRFFLFGGLIAGMTLATSATQFYHINGNPASINSADGELTDGGVDYLWSTKPPAKTGLARPSLVTEPEFDAAGRTIRMTIDSAWPDDDSDYNLTKSHYRICSGNWPQAPQVKVPNMRFCGFALRFGANYSINTGSTGMQIWQAWQGHGWPPCQLATDERNGNIRLYFLCSNDDCRGSENQHSAKMYLKDADGNDMIFQKDQWYSFVIQPRFDFTTAANGLVNCWVNGHLAASGKAIRMGYTPATVAGGQEGTLDGCDVHFGLYGPKSDDHREVYFAQVKLADNFMEALPALLTSSSPRGKNTVGPGWLAIGVADENTINTSKNLISQGGGNTGTIKALTLSQYRTDLDMSQARVDPD